MNLGRLAEVARAARALFFLAELFDFALEVVNLFDELFFLQPLRAHNVALLGELGHFAPQLLDARLRRGIAFFLQRLFFDLELRQASLEGIDLDGHRVDLHLDLGGRFVDEVDGLVGQETIGDVAVRERGGGDERVVEDVDAVMGFVALFQTA